MPKPPAHAKLNSTDATLPPSRQGRWRKPLVAAVAALAVAGGTWAALVPSGRAPSHAADGVKVTILVDGWSYLNLQNAHPQATPGLTNADATITNSAGQVIQSDPTTQTLVFTPVTGDQMKDIAKTTPGILQRVAARMFTTDRTLSCAADGCRTKSGQIPLKAFTDPGSARAYGDVYQGYGLLSALYEAQVTVPKGTTGLSLSGDGFKVYPLTLGSGSTADVGYGHNRFLMSAAWGRWFQPTPDWVGSSNGYAYQSPAIVGRAAAVGAKAGEMLAGQGVVSELAQSMTPDQLTYLSSPSTGCGPALCVPGQATVTAPSSVTSEVAVCAPGEPTIRAVIDDTRETVTFTSPVHQAGAYAGHSPLTFPNATSTELVPGDPVLAQNTQTLRFTRVFYVGSDGVDDVESRIAQAPYNPSASGTLTATASEVLPVLAWGQYKPC